MPTENVHYLLGVVQGQLSGVQTSLSERKRIDERITARLDTVDKALTDVGHSMRQRESRLAKVERIVLGDADTQPHSLVPTGPTHKVGKLMAAFTLIGSAIAGLLAGLRAKFG